MLGLRVDPKDAVPIWKQIEEGLRRLVASGSLEVGAALPSVRDLARDLQVNPMTVSKAYQRLTDQGVVESRRGSGTFVAEGSPGLARGERARVLREHARRYASVAATLGATEGEALKAIAAAWEETKSRPSGDKR